MEKHKHDGTLIEPGCCTCWGDAARKLAGVAHNGPPEKVWKRLTMGEMEEWHSATGRMLTGPAIGTA